MKKLTFGLCVLAAAMFAAAVADAQTGGGGGGAGGAGAGSSGASSGASGTSGTSGTSSGTAASSDPSSIQTGSSGVPGSAGARGNFQSPQQGAGAQQPGLPGTQPSQFNRPTALEPQTGPRPQSSDPAIQTRRNYDPTGSRIDQSTGSFDRPMSPPDRQAQGFDADIQTRGQQDQYDQGQFGATNGQQRDQYGQMTQGRRGELGVWLMASNGRGVAIQRVTEGSAAAEIGLRPGDMLLQINGQPVATPTEVQRLIRSIPAGQTAMLEVWRDGAQQEVSVTLQPMRESYRSGYRGEETPARRGDLESRTMRLEEQLSMVMRELQQIRADIAQRNQESSGQASGFDNQPSTTQPQAGAFDEFEPQSEPNEFEQPATQPGPGATEFDASPTESEPAESTATEPAETEPATTEPAEDLFGSEPAEPAEPGAETTPDEETETEAETDADADLFQ